MAAPLRSAYGVTYGVEKAMVCTNVLGPMIGLPGVVSASVMLTRTAITFAT